MLTFGTTWRSAKSATYSVLTHFHADTTSPEACFVHGCVPPGPDPHGNIKDEGLVVDLRRRQESATCRGRRSEFETTSRGSEAHSGAEEE